MSQCCGGTIDIECQMLFMEGGDLAPLYKGDVDRSRMIVGMPAVRNAGGYHPVQPGVHCDKMQHGRAVPATPSFGHGIPAPLE